MNRSIHNRINERPSFDDLARITAYTRDQMNRLFEEEQIRRVLAFEPIGEVWPYSTGSKELIETFLQELVADIERGGEMIRETDQTKSYLSIEILQGDEHGAQKQNGQFLFLSRLAPVAVYGTMSLGENQSLQFYQRPPGDQWRNIEEAICSSIEHFNINLLPATDLSAFVPFDSLSPPYDNNSAVTYFDLFFGRPAEPT